MFEEAAKAIEELLQDNWLATPIDFDNTTYKPVQGTPFVRLQIEWAISTPTSIGAGRVEGSGYIDISIFTPATTGTRQAYKYADQLALLYNKYNIDGLTCLAATTQRVGQQEEWFQLKVLIPFTYTQCYT